MRSVILGLATAIMGLSFLATTLFGTALHLLTVYVAYQSVGFMGAALTLFFPVIAQLYWLVSIWAETGMLFNLYTMACLAYLAIWVVIIFAGAIATAADSRH